MDRLDLWFKERVGRFTASQANLLLISGKNGDMFGVGANTYIKQKAVETITTLWERPELDAVASLLHGKAHELPAFEAYIRETRNTSMRYFGSDDPLFLVWGEKPNDCGGSPDGIMGEGLDIVLGMELKCPKNPSVHFDHLLLKDQYALKDFNIAYYTQCQTLLMITGAEAWHWVSYDGRYTDRKRQLKIIEILPEKSFLDDLKVRLKSAIIKKKELIEKLNQAF